MIPPRREEWWLGNVVWAAGPPIVRTVGRLAWRLDIDLGPGFPDPPFVVAANHHSFLDAVLIGAAYGRKIRFLGLVDLFGHHRLLDATLIAVDVIPIGRGTVPLGAMRQALRHLEEGGSVGLFPEGIRHTRFDPSRALPGAAWLATRAEVPLVPVAVAGTEQVLGVDNRLHTGRIRVTVGPALFGTGEGRAAVDDLTRRWAIWVAETLESPVNMRVVGRGRE